MLRRVAPADVQLGMYVQGFDGTWLEHPFWRTRFLVSSSDQLARIRASTVAAVVIDETRGKPAPRRQPAGRALPPPTAPGERERARQLVAQAKRAVAALFDEVRLGRTARVQDMEALVADVTASVSRDPHALLGVARLKELHEYTYMHSISVCALMINFARHLGLSEADVREAGLAGLFHDLGKAMIDPDVLDKPGRLNEAEFEQVKAHPEIGHALLVMSGSDVPDAVLDACLHHHERWAGGGYPHGLQGEAIGRLARMTAICDVYDAVTSDRAYKGPWAPAKAIGQMRGWAGHFDPTLLDAFIASIAIYPPGVLVRLASGRFAIVAGTNEDEPTKPPVLLLRQQGGTWLASTRALLDSDQVLHMEDPETVQIMNWTDLQALAVS